MIEDFVVKGHSMSYGRVLDYERIVGLSDNDFARLYLELMEEYRDKDGWWSNGKIPKCGECHSEISNPKQLRRYCGLSMHPSCFKQFYEREGNDKGIIKQYWQKVANLSLDF